MHFTPLEIILTLSTLLELNPIFQTAKIIKNKEAEDVSIWTFATIMLIGSLWLAYSIQIKSLPMILGNGIKLFSSFTVIIAYAIYRKKP